MSDPEIVYFESKWAHYFIFGCAILSIVWGVINVLIVSIQKHAKRPCQIWKLISARSAFALVSSSQAT